MEEKKQFAVVIALVRDKEGKILLQKRVDSLIPDADGTWELPGGKIDYGETPEDAVMRECREEAGCEIQIKRLLPKVQSMIWQRVDGKEQHVIVFCYEAIMVGGTVVPSDKKVAEVGWFMKSEAEKLNLLRGTMEFINLI